MMRNAGSVRIVLRGIEVLVGAILIAACAGPGGLDRAPSAASVESANFLKPAGRSGYIPHGLCDGYPRLSHLKTPPGICVGQVASGFKMPRGVLEFDPKNFPNQFLVTDMGSWEPNTGILWLVRPVPGEAQFEMIKLLEKMDLPHAIIFGPEPKEKKRAWIATANQILRVNVTGLDTAHPVAKTEVVIDGLPGRAPKGQNYRHPLKSIVFDRKMNLWLNVGSHSNNCEREDFAKNLNLPKPLLCSEADGPNPNGVIRKFVFDWSVNPPKPLKTSIVARGLRNSVALTAYTRNGLILQAENGRDSINKSDPALSDDLLPHEEINVIQEGKHYGWPYCYDDNLTSPEFRKYKTRAACATREKPALLLPPHSAPLGIIHYRRSLFPKWYREKLLVSLHGYRPAGHRIVAYETHEDGVPFGDSYDIVSGWDARDGQPMGAPVTLTLARDGSVYVIEDKNRTLLKIFYDPSEGDGIPKVSADIDLSSKTGGESTEVIAERCSALGKKKTRLAEIQRKVIDVSCVNCHRSGDLAFKICDDLGSAKVLRGEGGKKVFVTPFSSDRSPFYARLISAGAPMPPYPTNDEREVLMKMIPQIKAWIDSGAKDSE
jgi:glucose/arabinose dehydrogenase